MSIHQPSSNKESELTEEEIIIPRKLGNAYIRIRPNRKQTENDNGQESDSTVLPPDDPGRGRISYLNRLKQILIGRPIPYDQAMHEHIGRFKALAVLSSDALSSVAYGTEASMAVLATAGLTFLTTNLLLGAIVVGLLSIVAISYRQTIFHYPNGGGSYIVAKDNLGPQFGLIAAGALLIDYILTVSVSVSSGIDALSSAFPALVPWDVVLGVSTIGFILIINLRGVRESGTIFALPTYLFVVSFLIMIVIGVVFAITQGGLFQASPPRYESNQGIPIRATESISLFLILTAFASGCSAMTGTEAISNGIPIFKQPQTKNAAATLTLMAALLGVMYAGTTFLAWRFGAVPYVGSTPTVTSQLASIFFIGPFGWFYYVFQVATMLILVLAANTSFADFPRLCSILARDNYLPHMFQMQGDRLAFTSGIVVLGTFASILLVSFRGVTEALINLYALGVFMAFTLSQSGMVVRWIRKREEGWKRGLAINLFGAIVTGIVMVVIAISKFDRGAWIVVILIPILYVLFRAINIHYQNTHDHLATMKPLPINPMRHIAVVPVADIDPLALRGLAYARSLTPFVLAVHVVAGPEQSHEIDEIKTRWQKYVINSHALSNGPRYDDLLSENFDELSQLVDEELGIISGPQLVLIPSPYRALARPVIEFIDRLQEHHTDTMITVILPEYVPSQFWQLLLHNQTALLLKLRLWRRANIVTANIPYQPH
jgi:amino acid transporter